MHAENRTPVPNERLNKKLEKWGATADQITSAVSHVANGPKISHPKAPYNARGSELHSKFFIELTEIFSHFTPDQQNHFLISGDQRLMVAHRSIKSLATDTPEFSLSRSSKKAAFLRANSSPSQGMLPLEFNAKDSLPGKSTPIGRREILYVMTEEVRDTIFVVCGFAHALSVDNFVVWDALFELDKVSPAVVRTDFPDPEVQAPDSLVKPK